MRSTHSGLVIVYLGSLERWQASLLLLQHLPTTPDVLVVNFAFRFRLKQLVRKGVERHGDLARCRLEMQANPSNLL